MLYLISILPIAVYLVIVKMMDGFALASPKKIIMSLCWGGICCAAAYYAGVLLEGETGEWFPLVEEVLKCLPLIIMVCCRKCAFLAEMLIYGAAIGGGFAFAENVTYIWLNELFSVGDAILRGFGTALLHMGCTALFASLILLAFRASEKSFVKRVVLFIAAVAPSSVIHWTYNQFFLPELLQLIIVVALMLLLFLIIFNIDFRQIHKWLDVCIANDISLLSAIRNGKLRDTPAGKYLGMIKERFKPEVFFDICVYLGLYLELSIAAKSRMIMKEAGVDVRLDDKEQKENLDKIVELKNLKKSIGATGLAVLNPITGQKVADEWVIDELLQS